MKEIASAFVKAKKDFAPAIKNSINGHLRQKYADLSACIDAVNDAFLKNGIAMYQETFEDNAGVTVETVLLHESGEFLRFGKLHLPAPKQDPQGYGSALSYARRYSLLTACGIAPEDDDGEAAATYMQRKQERKEAEARESNIEQAAAIHAILAKASHNGKAALSVAWKALSPHDRQLFGGAENLKQFEEIVKAADEKAAQ